MVSRLWVENGEEADVCSSLRGEKEGREEGTVVRKEEGMVEESG